MTETSPVSVPADVLADCALERWPFLPTERREAVAAELAQALAASGYTLHLWRMEAHGPEGEQPVLIFTDAETRLDFALIPGGTLLPGYDEAAMQRYRAIYTIVERRDHGEEWDEDFDEEIEERLLAQTIDRPKVFASEAPCDLRRKSSVSIAPFLMATLPAVAKMPGMSLRWERVAPMLGRYGWEVPTTHEWEWAAQGGRSGIFYWGDEVPRFVVNCIVHYAQDEEEAEEYGRRSAEMDAQIEAEWPDEERVLLTNAVRFEDVMELQFPASKTYRWPAANRFGLVGLHSWGEWCAPSEDPDEPFPLIVRGGAGGCFPWQICGEWMLLLSAAERRLSIKTDYADSNVVRPVILLWELSERS